jgi:hypothetical protein
MALGRVWITALKPTEAVDLRLEPAFRGCKRSLFSMTAMSTQQSLSGLPDPDLNLSLFLNGSAPPYPQQPTTPFEITRSLRSQTVMWIRLPQKFEKALRKSIPEHP